MLPDGSFQKRPQTCFTNRALQHLREVFFNSIWAEPGGVGYQQVEHDSRQILLEDGCGVSLSHNEENKNKFYALHISQRECSLKKKEKR